MNDFITLFYRYNKVNNRSVYIWKKISTSQKKKRKKRKKRKRKCMQLPKAQYCCFFFLVHLCYLCIYLFISLSFPSNTCLDICKADNNEKLYTHIDIQTQLYAKINTQHLITLINWRKARPYSKEYTRKQKKLKVKYFSEIHFYQCFTCFFID